MHSSFVSVGTTLTLALGLVLAVGYLHFMWRALQRAIASRDAPDLGKDRYARSFIGALVAVVGSVGAVASYGLGPLLLYVGPALALLSAAAVALCLREEATESDPGPPS